MEPTSQVPFTCGVSISPADIDEMGHVNNVVYVRWVQEVAQSHWELAASSSLRARYAWVLLRHEIEYLKPAFLGDVIEGQTWVGKHEGPRFDRFVQLINRQTNAVIARSTTTWCLLDGITKKPKRIESDILSVLQADADSLRRDSV